MFHVTLGGIIDSLLLRHCIPYNIPERTCYNGSYQNESQKITVTQIGSSFPYTVPSFPVFTVSLRKVKFEWTNAQGQICVFDGYMRECGLLHNRSLPAVAVVANGFQNAFFVNVRVI